MADENREEIRQLVIGWVDELMEKGETLSGAASQAVDQLISGRKASTFLLECGPAAVANIWRMQNAYRRNAAQRPGERKVQPGALGKEESILESLHSVGDDWVRVGDMDKEMCREVQRAFNSLAEGNVRQAQFFSRIADNLKPGQTVRGTFTDDQLRSFVQEVRID